MSAIKQTAVPIFPVLLVNFIGILGYSIVIPILVFIVNKFGGNGFLYGLLGATYPAFQLIGAPVLGKWSDRIGRKRVLFISQIGTLLAWLLFVLALTLPIRQLFEVEQSWVGNLVITLPLLVLFLARALDGLTGGNVSVANAYLSDISTEENRKANFGKMASSTSLGFIIGPTVAGLLGAVNSGDLWTVILAATISLTALFVIQRYLPESRQNLVEPDTGKMDMRKLFLEEQRECYQMENCPDISFKTIIKQPGIPLLYLIYFLTFLSFSFFFAGFPVYVAQDLSWSPAQLGIYLTVSSAIMVMVQGPGLNYLSDKVSDKGLVVVGSLLIAVSFLLLMSTSIIWLYVANVFRAVGNGLMWPSFLSILSGTGSSFIQGAIQGYGNSMGSLASIIGLVGGGVFFATLGPSIFMIAFVVMLLITISAFLGLSI